MPDWLLPLILAPFAGGFAAVLIRRLPMDEAVVGGDSRCIVSRISFVARRCAIPISYTHLATELACLAIAVWVVLAEPDVHLVWLDCVLGWALLTLAWIDWRHMLLPDVLTLPLVVAGLGATLLQNPAAAMEHAAAASTGYLAFRAIESGYRRLRGRDGLGEGDAKLMAAGGAWLGLAALPTVAFTAALFGLATEAALRIGGHRLQRDSALPFGPALCAAIWVAVLGFDPIATLMEWLQ